MCGKEFSEVKRKLVVEDYLKSVRDRIGVSDWFGFRLQSGG